MEVSAERAPRTFPSIYRGVATMARVVRDGGALEKVAQREEVETGGPKLLEGSTDRRPNDVEIAPGIYRY